MALTQVGTDGVKDDAVTLAKQAAGTDGQIITYDASGNPVAVGPGTDGQVLTSTGAGSPPAFEDIPAKAALTGSTNNTVCTVTGANAIQGEANLTFDGSTLKLKADNGEFVVKNASNTDAISVDSDNGNTYIAGNVGIGTTAPTDYDAEADNFVVASSDHTGVTIASTGTDKRNNIYFADGTSGNAQYRGAFTYDHSDDSLLARTAGAERLRIDSSGNVNINTTTAVGKITLKGTNNSGSAAYGLTNSGKASQGIDISCTTVGDGNFGGAVSFGCGGNGRSGIAAYQDGADDDKNGLVFLTHSSTAGTDNAVERMRIYADGYVTKPAQPFFRAHGSGAWTTIATGDGTVVFPFATEVSDVGGNYDTSNSRFTAPVDGIYVFHVTTYGKANSSSGYMSFYFRKNGSGSSQMYRLRDYSDEHEKDKSLDYTQVLVLSANDYVDFSANADGDSWQYYGSHCVFQGYLLG